MPIKKGIYRILFLSFILVILSASVLFSEDANTGTYTVQKGDCLWNIAALPSIYSDSTLWAALWVENGRFDLPNLIKPGLVLTFKKNLSDQEKQSYRSEAVNFVNSAAVALTQKEIDDRNAAIAAEQKRIDMENLKKLHAEMISNKTAVSFSSENGTIKEALEKKSKAIALKIIENDKSFTEADLPKIETLLKEKVVQGFIATFNQFDNLGAASDGIVIPKGLIIKALKKDRSALFFINNNSVKLEKFDKITKKWVKVQGSSIKTINNRSSAD